MKSGSERQPNMTQTFTNYTIDEVIDTWFQKNTEENGQIFIF